MSRVTATAMFFQPDKTTDFCGNGYPKNIVICDCAGEPTHAIRTLLCNTYLIDRHRGFSGPMKHNETTEQLLRIPTGRRQTTGQFTSAAGKLNQGLPGTNSTSGQSGC